MVAVRDEDPDLNECIRHAVRLLHAAEMELDLKKMERLEKLADSWASVAGLLLHRENSQKES